MGALKPLTDKQQRFVEEYVVDMNASAAARRAGYAVKTSGMYTTIMLPHVALAVREALAEKRARAAIDADAVLAELGKVAFANVLDYGRVGEGGAFEIDLALARYEAGAAISRVSVDYFPQGEGEARRVRRVSLTMADKTAALREIARHLGLYRDKLDVSVRAARDERPDYCDIVTGVPRRDNPTGRKPIRMWTAGRYPTDPNDPRLHDPAVINPRG